MSYSRGWDGEFGDVGVWVVLRLGGGAGQMGDWVLAMVESSLLPPSEFRIEREAALGTRNRELSICSRLSLQLLGLGKRYVPNGQKKEA